MAVDKGFEDYWGAAGNEALGLAGVSFKSECDRVNGAAKGTHLP